MPSARGEPVEDHIGDDRPALPAGRAGPEGHPVSEAEAQTLLTYSAILIPGLLQTEDYARAVIRGMLPELSSEEVERRVIARMDR